jgi:hypothetical protein
MSNTRLRRGVAHSAVAIALIGAYHLGRAFASGIPTTNPLVYTGTLLNNGAPATSPQNIGLSLWTDPSSNTSQVCDVPSGSVTLDALGRFSIPLNATCLSAVGANPDLYAEVDVAGAQVGTRTHLGAVPYAVEANHAVNADNATDGGSVSSALTNLRNLTSTINVVTNPSTGLSLTVAGAYCGQTAATNGAVTFGTLVGWPATKALCQQTCSADTAHMCLNDEVVRNTMLGISLDISGGNAAWYATGILSAYPGSAIPSDDCQGFTTASGSYSAMGWQGGAAQDPDQYSCNTSLPILCCN